MAIPPFASPLYTWNDWVISRARRARPLKRPFSFVSTHALVFIITAGEKGLEAVTPMRENKDTTRNPGMGQEHTGRTTFVWPIPGLLGHLLSIVIYTE